MIVIINFGKISIFDNFRNCTCYPTQEDVARELKVTQRAISSWLSDRTNMNFHICSNPLDSLQITTTWDFPQCDKEENKGTISKWLSDIQNAKISILNN